MLVLWLFLQAGVHASSAQYEAGCAMKLHNTTDEIGNVVFRSDQGFQWISGTLEADPNIVKKDRYGLYVYENSVTENSCEAASDTADQLKLAEIAAGERGEINFDLSLTIDPTKDPQNYLLVEPEIYCSPIKVKIYADGREEPYVERRKRSEGETKKPKRRKIKKNGGKKVKNKSGNKKVKSNANKETMKNNTGKKKKPLKGKQGCTKQRRLKGKCNTVKNNVDDNDNEEFFLVVEKMPDCYSPRKNNIKQTLKTPKFELDGEQSIVGHTVVLYREERVDHLSIESGNYGSAIACCTLKLTEGF